jgi:hypothetical protein
VNLSSKKIFLSVEGEGQGIRAVAGRIHNTHVLWTLKPTSENDKNYVAKSPILVYKAIYNPNSTN